MKTETEELPIPKEDVSLDFANSCRQNRHKQTEHNEKFSDLPKKRRRRTDELENWRKRYK